MTGLQVLERVLPRYAVAVAIRYAYGKGGRP